MKETMFTISSFKILKKTHLEKPQKYANFQQLINQVCTLSTTISIYIVLPLRNVDIHATRVNGLSVRKVGGVRTLFQDNQPVETVSLGKSLENFVTYLEKTVRRVKSDNNIYTVGHNSQVFDNPTLLRQLAEAAIIIANEQLKKAEAAAPVADADSK